MLGAHDQVPQPRPGRDADDEIVLARRDLLLLQFLVALDARLALRVAPRRVGLDPLELVLDEFLARLLRLRLARQHRLLLLQPLLVVALVRIADAAVELQDPVRHVRQEVAVVRHDDERALEVLQVLFEPLHGLGVQMVRRLVQKKHVRFRQKQAADRHAPPLAARKNRDLPVGGRTVHGRHRPLHERVDVPVVVRVDLVLEPRHLGFRLRVVEIAAEFLIAVQFGLDGRHRLGDGLPDRLGVVEHGLLRQIPDARALGDLHGAHDVRVQPGQDLQKRRFAGAVPADHADVRPVEEGQIDVLQYGFRADLLCDVYETELVFARHDMWMFPYIIPFIPGFRRLSDA